MSKVWGGLEVFGPADGEPLHTAKALWLIIRLASKPLHLRAFQSQQVNNFSAQIAQQHTSNAKSSMTNFKSRNTLFACMWMQALLAMQARFHASLHLEMHLRGMFVHTVWFFFFYMKPWLSNCKTVREVRRATPVHSLSYKKQAIRSENEIIQYVFLWELCKGLHSSFREENNDTDAMKRVMLARPVMCS